MNPVFGLRTIEVSHNGADMAVILTEVLWADCIWENLGYFVGDNASNNVTLVRHLAEAQVESNRLYNALEFRLQWVGHEITPSVKEFWSGDVDSIHL
jgi:hypothetical protein